MAGLSMSGSRRGRALDLELPLVPFLDFLVCLVMFLLVTATWSEWARLEANARELPRESSGEPSELPLRRVLHVDARSAREFVLDWREGSTVVSRETIPRVPRESGLRYESLARALELSQTAHGQHRHPDDGALDHAVLHVDNDVPFEEVAAFLDAIHAPRRALGSGTTELFAVALAD